MPFAMILIEMQLPTSLHENKRFAKVISAIVTHEGCINVLVRERINSPILAATLTIAPSHAVPSK